MLITVIALLRLCVVFHPPFLTFSPKQRGVAVCCVLACRIVLHACYPRAVTGLVSVSELKMQPAALSGDPETFCLSFTHPQQAYQILIRGIKPSWVQRGLWRW